MSGHGVSQGEASRVWLRIALLSFGGPAGQIAVMHRILVDEKRWVGEQRFLHALNYCMLLPGPEAQQLATYLGWLMHRTLGGLIAGGLFILPGFVSILGLSLIYVAFGHTTIVSGLFFGLKAAVLAIVVQAVIRIGKRTLRNNAMLAIAALAFLGLFLVHLPFPLIIALAGLAGYLGGRAGLPQFLGAGGHGAGKAGGLTDADSLLGEQIAAHAQPNLRWSLTISAIFLVLWLAPVLALSQVLGPDNVFTQIAVFFSKMAVVTFGGAYAVLAWVSQEAVQNMGWLTPGEMLDGLGMAETTPGPLIMVLQFVGFIAAWRDSGALNPYVAATLASVLTVWVTFMPCFLWIFLGAPYVESLRGNRALSSALTAISAAVVGVVLNLALWFALHLIFTSVSTLHLGGLSFDVPDAASVDLAALVLVAASMLAILRFGAGTFATLAASAVAGLAWTVVAA